MCGELHALDKAATLPDFLHIIFLNSGRRAWIGCLGCEYLSLLKCCIGQNIQRIVAAGNLLLQNRGRNPICRFLFQI